MYSLLFKSIHCRDLVGFSLRIATNPVHNVHRAKSIWKAVHAPFRNYRARTAILELCPLCSLHAPPLAHLQTCWRRDLLSFLLLIFTVLQIHLPSELVHATLMQMKDQDEVYEPIKHGLASCSLTCRHWAVFIRLLLFERLTLRSGVDVSLLIASQRRVGYRDDANIGRDHTRCTR